ncbi:DNA-binding transcriptional LysR family regulator [Aequitasia blattaphilus]|uniref:LysR family transcriptional regulator n=1 Tax=Aequitasia blattaphilus TaxID=2949332 RepID=A0ABT1EBG9_9FIRM|nr:LysR family transcriptional regulator [Aequitasia blattaphilus]MCP1101857.1 LysR family transcriptional regulator [Aequitasia blattaphilus]MCR8614497.1 LysR family transcriptional regulator [Aequitasia blattaphilus]
MTLKQLEYFLEIARMSSISKAAQNLNISQPPLSMQLKSLEDELETYLFIRDNRNLQITPEGELLQERLNAIFALLKETKQEIKALSVNREMILRIGTIGSVNNRLLPTIISRFRREYQYVNFLVMEGTTDSVFANLLADKIDLGFVREPFNSSGFHSIYIQDPALLPDEKDYFVTIAHSHFYDDYFNGSNEKNLPLEALRNKPLVIHKRYRELLLNACRKKGFSPHIVCENGEIQSSLSWAQAGIGIAIAPYTSAVMNTDPTLIKKRLDSIFLSPRVCLIWKQSTKLSPETLALLAMI